MEVADGAASGWHTGMRNVGADSKQSGRQGKGAAYKSDKRMGVCADDPRWADEYCRAMLKAVNAGGRAREQ